MHWFPPRSIDHAVETPQAQVAPERLVVQTYEAQLLALFSEIPDIAQRHSRDFTEVFFGCFQRDDAFTTSEDRKSVV